MGTPVKADASFSVSRALQLQLPKQLAVLEEVSEYASREYSLERALDKMQVCFWHGQQSILNNTHSSTTLSNVPLIVMITSRCILLLPISYVSFVPVTHLQQVCHACVHVNKYLGGAVLPWMGARKSGSHCGLG